MTRDFDDSNIGQTKCSHGHDSGVFICIKDLAERVRELEDTVNTVHKYTNQDRIDIRKLQEWKQGHIGQSNADVKVIDKQVWQEIKNVVACKPYWYDGGMHNAVHDKLIQLIKQVDPEWEPSK